MRLKISIYSVMIVIFFLGLGVFTQTSNAAEQSNHSGIEKILKDIGNTLSIFSSPHKEKAGQKQG